MKDIEVKIKQHYVPQFYLKNWLGRDGIWINHKTDKNKIPYVKKNTRDVGEERYFYESLIDDVIYDMLAYKYSKQLESKDEMILNIFSDLKLFQLLDDAAYKKKELLSMMKNQYMN